MATLPAEEPQPFHRLSAVCSPGCWARLAGNSLSWEEDAGAPSSVSVCTRPSTLHSRAARESLPRERCAQGCNSCVSDRQELGAPETLIRWRFPAPSWPAEPRSAHLRSASLCSSAARGTNGAPDAAAQPQYCMIILQIIIFNIISFFLRQ